MRFDPRNPSGWFADQIAAAQGLDALADVLLQLLDSGLGVWTDGSLYFTRARVHRLGHLSLEVYPRDHNPPHFHVHSSDGSAVFKLEDCSLWKGSLATGDRVRVEWFFRNGGQEKLTEAWERLRPNQKEQGTAHSRE